MRNERHAGGVECAFLYLYSFFMQHQLLPADRTEDDTMLLRATVFHADQSMLEQLADSADIIGGLSMDMANTLDKLEDECTMLNFRTLV
jgi:hypothetical protein